MNARCQNEAEGLGKYYPVLFPVEFTAVNASIDLTLGTINAEHSTRLDAQAS